MNPPHMISQVKPSTIRKYFYEYVVVGLVFAVSYLIVRVEILNSYIREKQAKIIQDNTNALNLFNNNFYNIKIKEYEKAN